jgi:hypothetical protein
MDWKLWLKDSHENKGKEQNKKEPLFDQTVSSYRKAKTVLKVNPDTHVSCVAAIVLTAVSSLRAAARRDRTISN